MRYGIDISKDNFVSSWDLVKGSDVEFCFIKASEGITIQDPMYRKHRLGAERVKIPTYAYHFFRPLDDGIQQAKNFLAAAGSITRMALDLESCIENGQDQWAMVSEPLRYQRIKDFLSLMPAATDIQIYIGTDFFEKYLPKADLLAEYGLWLPRYANETGPIPKVWKKYDFWQHDDNGVVPGISGSVDLSFANDHVIL